MSRHSISRLLNLLLVGAILLSGCTVPVEPDALVRRFLDDGEGQLGERPAQDPAAAVEAYLQRYQPGELPRLFQTTRVYDRNGVLIAELADAGRRTWAPLNAVSPFLVQATVATEDASFFSNDGIDLPRIIGAIVQNVEQEQVVSGASTITMQLARNLFLQADDRYDLDLDRKLLEARLAQELTDLYSKDEILEMYLNLLNYGQLAYGPEAAAQTYFGKAAADLTLAEASMLAGIPQQPAVLNPFTNLDGVKARQRIVLDLMVRHGYLDQATADAVHAEPLALVEESSGLVNRAPHFVRYVENLLDARLGDGYLRRAGLNIYTTLDMTMQDLAQTVVSEQVSTLRPRFDLSNAALVAFKPNSGQVLAMVGSADFDNAAIAGQVNVTLRQRQPGSAIKPILYAAALDDNRISPASVIWDTPARYEIDDNQLYRPRNYDNRFHGPVTVRTALANSYNVPAIKLLDALTVPRMVDQALKMGLSSLDREFDFYGLSLGLGAGEVTLFELTNAYNILASGGLYHTPAPILTITDAQGRPPADWPQEAPPTRIVSQAAAFLVTDILADNEARTPAFGANSPLNLSRPAAAKTGTTNDWRDNWTIGYTRYLVAGVWAGNSDGRPMRNASGITGAAPIWNTFMEAVLADPTLLDHLGAPQHPGAWNFTPPFGVVQEDVCPPGVRCRTDGEYFSRTWVDATGNAGPLLDTMAVTSGAPVYAIQGEATRLVGYCWVEGAARRLAVRLPDTPGIAYPLGALGIEIAPEALLSTTPITGTVRNLVDAPLPPSAAYRTDLGEQEERRRVTVTEPPVLYGSEQLQALAWSLNGGPPLRLGPCDGLEQVVRSALALRSPRGGVRVVVDLAAAADPAVAATPGRDAVQLAAVSGAISNAAEDTVAAPPSRYVLSGPVRQDNQCPGSYVLGLVANRDGAPVPGITVVMNDEWGNRYVAVTKAGAGDAGQFDFPIYSGSAHRIEITVLDVNGNVASPVVEIGHLQGDNPQATCHHVFFRGG